VSNQLVRFYCPGCNKRMKAPTAWAGRTGTCRNCSTRICIPAVAPAVASSAAPTPALVQAQSPQTGTVPVKVSFPKECGNVETQVSQPAADSIAQNVVTGVLVEGQSWERSYW
jgi:hypothetical protein